MAAYSPSNALDAGRLISESWHKFSENIGLLIGAYAVVLLILAVLGWPSMGLAHFVLSGPLAYGVLTLTLRVVRNQPASFEEVFSGFQRFLPTFLAGLLIAVLTTIGTIFCVLPGLFVSMIYMLTYFYMYDRNLDFWPAMEASRVTVMNNLGQWFLVWLIAAVLVIIGSALCGIGIFFTCPIAGLIVAMAYNQTESGAIPVEPATEPFAE